MEVYSDIICSFYIGCHTNISQIFKWGLCFIFKVLFCSVLTSFLTICLILSQFLQMNGIVRKCLQQHFFKRMYLSPIAKPFMPGLQYFSSSIFEKRENCWQVLWTLSVSTTSILWIYLLRVWCMRPHRYASFSHKSLVSWNNCTHSILKVSHSLKHLQLKFWKFV